MTVSFDFYQTVYGGQVIQSEAEFLSAVNEATAIVDALCVCKENLKYEEVQNRYSMAVCSVVDAAYKADNTPVKTSESVGNHSVSYATENSSRNVKLNRAAKLYLVNTGLMYGGMC